MSIMKQVHCVLPSQRSLIGNPTNISVLDGVLLWKLKKMWNIIAINEVSTSLLKGMLQVFWLSSEPLQSDVNIRFSDYSISFHFCAKTSVNNQRKQIMMYSVHVMNILVCCPLYICWFKLKDSFEHNIRNKVQLSCYKCYHLAVFSMLVTRTYVSISHAVLEIVNISCYKQIQIPDSLLEIHLQGIMVIVFSGTSPRLGNIKYNHHDSL